MSLPRPNGFTLVEVVAGLAVAALVLLVARASLESVRGAEGPLSRGTERLTAVAGGDAALRDLASSAMVNDRNTASGSPTSLTFGSWCRSAGGWREACSVTLTVAADSTVRYATSIDSVMRQGFRGSSRLRLAYLRSVQDGGRWSRTCIGGEWPLAIGIVSTTDTVVLPFGARYQ